MKVTYEHRTWLVDIDGTLCEGAAYSPEECLAAKPKMEMVAKVNELSLRDYIIIYTARQDFLIPATLAWLRKHGVIFHAISNNKIPGVQVDDRCLYPDAFLKEVCK